MRAFIFPGQGSQHIGMGKELYDNFLEAKEVFQEVDDTLKQKLSQLIFYGDIAELTQTSNTQPAIMAVSVATMRVIEKQSGKKMADLCRYSAGHSLGEYSAYAAVGSFALADTAKLLRIRGDAMQAADPDANGAMLALVGADIEQAEKLCTAVQAFGICQVANDNGAGQVVLSGVREAIEEAIDLAAQFGIRRQVKLNVSTAFHSALMTPAKEAMSSALKQVPIKRADVEVLANLSTTAIIEPDEIRHSLTEQVTNRVRWRETMEFMIHAGIMNFIEVGPGKVLINLAKKIDSNTQTASISNAYDVEEFLKNI